MAKPKSKTIEVNVKKEKIDKKTSIGSSRNTVYKSKNDKRNKKYYRGQGR